MGSKGRRLGKLLALLLVATLVLCAVLFLKGFLEIDGCLDRGGRWSYERERCEGAETSPASTKVS